MSRLSAELSRLYRVPAPARPEQGAFVAPHGTVKALVLEIANPADWADLSAVWHGTQSDLALPAAAIAVSGTDGLQLWFSLADPIEAQEATVFLSGLQRKYLPDIPAKRIRCYPATTAASGGIVHAREVPTAQDNGNWSAFVSPDLASVFGEEPWLDIPPSPDQQADMLAKVKSIKPAQFREAMTLLGRASSQAEPIAKATPKAQTTEQSTPGNAKMGPREFLLQVMNDPAVDLKDRMDAAKALLPYLN